jgi:hypothetical protein
MAKYKHELERENRDNYNSLMLLMIAQPTRKNPEALPRYKKLFERARPEAKEKTGEELLLELING